MDIRKYYQYTLTRGANSIVADNNPAGWNAAGITYTRNDVYHSVLRSGIPELKFVKELKVWIDSIIDTYGINSSLDIEIEIKETNPITLQYDIVFFTGILDLKTYKQERFFTTCDCIDNSKLAKFISRDDIEVEFARTKTLGNEDVDAISNMPLEIDLPGIDLFRYAETDAYNSLNTYTSPTVLIAYIKNRRIIKSDLIANVTINDDFVYKNTDAAAIEVEINGVFEINGDVTFIGVGSLQIDATINITNGSDILFTYSYPTIEITGDSETKDILESIIVDETQYVSNDYYIEIIFECTPDNSLFQVYFNSPLFYIFEKNATIGTTVCNGFLPHELASRLLQIITDETDTSKLLRSELIGRTDSEFQTYDADGAAAYMFLTNGYYIRRLTQKSFKTSFKDFFKALKTWYPCGFWYDAANDYFIIEELSQFYQNVEIMDIGEVKDLVITPATDIYYNLIAAGYQKKTEYKEYNGVNEINVPAQYNTVISTVKNTLDIQSPYRGDSVGIELAKRASTISKDTDYDNDNFAIDCKLDGSDVIVNQDTTATSEDIPGIEQYFNLRFTPKRILLNNSDLVTPCLFKNQLSYLQFVNNQQDNNASTTVSGSTKTEKEDQIVNSIFSPYFLPIKYDFKKYLNSEMIGLINTNPHGYVTFHSRGTTYKGFILEVGKGGYQKEGNWLLIAVND